MASTNESSGTVSPPKKKEPVANDVKATNKNGKETKKKSVRVSFSAIAAYTEVLCCLFCG